MSKPPPSFVADDDGCSICLEPFSCRDPRTVTNCNHSYHLQCVLEWSQRSKECPICCRQLVLKDFVSQDLLAAVGFESNATSTHVVHNVGASHVDDSDVQERFLQHPLGVTNTACFDNRMRRQPSSRVGKAHALPSFPVASSSSNMHQMSDSLEESQRPVNELGNGISASGISSSSIGPASSSRFSSVANVAPSTTTYGGGSGCLSESSPENLQKLSTSEFLDLECTKSELNKESFSKNMKGFKEKLLAHKNSVKEIGREVEREMSVSIAGLAKMVERLDLSSKHRGASGPLSSYAVGTSDFRQKGKSHQGSLIPQLNNDYSWGSTSKMNSNITPLFSDMVPSQP